MKTKRLGLIVLILFTALILVGCARPAVVEEVPEPAIVEQPAVIAATDTDVPEVTEPPAEEPTIEEPEEPNVEAPQALDDDDERMQALISEKIGSCHILNFILSKNKTREDWSVTIDRMIGYGAKINAEEKELIIDYLVSRNE
jgi:PBP1b-binding outer membrane lipoprotein LpoB